MNTLQKIILCASVGVTTASWAKSNLQPVYHGFDETGRTCKVIFGERTLLGLGGYKTLIYPADRNFVLKPRKLDTVKAQSIETVPGKAKATVEVSFDGNAEPVNFLLTRPDGDPIACNKLSSGPEDSTRDVDASSAEATTQQH